MRLNISDQKERTSLLFGSHSLTSRTSGTLDDFDIISGSNITVCIEVSGGSYNDERYIHPSVKKSQEKCIFLLVENDTESIRVEMPCGHPVTPVGLAGYVDDQIKSGETKIKCPSCQMEWKVSEIIKRGLTQSEREALEQGLTKNNYTTYRECPKCGITIKKTDTGVKMDCSFCKSKGTSFIFCWSCKKEWKNKGSSYDNCGNDSCGLDKELQKSLDTCQMKTVDKISVPKIRVCPKCSKVIEHRDGCRRVVCPNKDCSTEFCFICLKVSDKGKRFPCYDKPCKSAASRQKLPKK